MWWLRCVHSLGIAVLVLAIGCGSEGFDSGGSESRIMSFQRFTGEGIDQADSVGNTSADVDVCPSICELTGFFEFEFERFTSTRVNAVFVNRGKADILLDRYAVSFPARPDIPRRENRISALLPGGRCASNPQLSCALDVECAGAICERQETPVELLLYDFVMKELLRGDGECPTIDGETGLIIPGNVIPQVLETVIEISGSDETGERFTISTGYIGNFTDFDNCDL